MTDRPSYEAVTAARAVIEAHYRADSGGCTSWRDRLAYDLARQEAHDTLCQVIGSLTEAVDAAEVTTLDDLRERLDEETDGMMVYNLSAAVYLLGSDNADAYAEEIGEAAPNENAAAVMALRADVIESPPWQELSDRVERIENGDDDENDDDGEG